MDIDSLLKTVYEIEALLKLMREGDDDPLKRTMLREIVDSLVDRLDDGVAIPDQSGETQSPDLTEPTDGINDEIAENAEFEQSEDADEDNTVIDESENEVHSVSEPVIDGKPDEEAPTDPEANDGSNETVNDTDSVLDEGNTVSDPVDDEIVIVVEDRDDSPDCNNDSSLSSAATASPAPVHDQSSDINETVLHLTAAKNLAKAFTINDKFRFRRELFGNSDRAFAEALSTVEAMKSKDEAEEYFYDNLGWDPDNEEVKDFMRIITAGFSA